MGDDEFSTRDVVDIGLVTRVEQAIATERKAFALGSKRERPDGAVLNVGPGLAVFTGPDLFSNRAFGLGLDDSDAADDLDQVEEFYRSRGLGTQIEVPTLAEPSFLAELANRSYRLVRFRNIYAMRPSVSRPKTGTIDVSMVDDDTASSWSDVLIEGFGYQDDASRDVIARWNRGLRETPGLHALMGHIDGRPVGSASVFITEEAAVLGGAATLPPWRRRGMQCALIAARLTLANESGCDLAVVTADPGSSSGRNAERAGFILVCTHAVLSRPV